MATYTYTHGGSTANDLIRLMIGDTRGTVGVATGWLFSDEELAKFVDGAYPSSGYVQAARAALVTRLCREAMNAGVAGTSDTSERPSAIAIALDRLDRLSSTNEQAAMTDVLVHDNEDLDTTGDDLAAPS